MYFVLQKHEKRAHLTLEERIIIQIRLKDGWRPNKIAREIGCAPNTIPNDIKRSS
ncbi:TPA: helix-turn-helix domain-containing protein [Streptococcus suis]